MAIETHNPEHASNWGLWTILALIVLGLLAYVAYASYRTSDTTHGGNPATINDTDNNR